MIERLLAMLTRTLHEQDEHASVAYDVYISLSSEGTNPSAVASARAKLEREKGRCDGLQHACALIDRLIKESPDL